MVLSVAASAAQVRAERGARVPRVPPPFYYGGAFAAGMLLRGAGGALAIGARPATAVIGAVVMAAGAALALAGIAEVVRHRTTIVPHRPVSTLVTTGAYRISRNPMYTYDKLTVKVGSTTLATYSNLNKGSGYTQKSFNVGAFAGHTVTVSFSATEDSSLQISFVIDDTALDAS